jgi:hypothetical protein
MKQFQALLLVLFLTVFTASAQSTRQYISLSVGPSFPSGDFGKTDINDSTSGWAKTGVAIQVAYAYRITHNIGVTAIVSYSGNSFDITSYKNALDAAHPDTMFSVESYLSWSSGSIMVGPYLRLPLSDKLSWDIRGLIGIFGSRTPRLTIRATTADGEQLPEYFRQTTRGFGFAWQVGTGFNLKMNKYYLLLFADYVDSSIDFDNTTGWDWNGEAYSTSFNQHVSYVSATIGLGVFF